ncbi:ribonuclease P protein component [Ancylobacter oerskovii]|uniref:Ribonuclease P protein component n=1 Tax=Ancylobacter oerskovii TaxID=459519 RepID=A0ABW4YTI8_9HYPH|nr:ribonuclease P protein component [Ancylobacter oerskovii]MBS7543432.1 ribonuclease P protein component [Ancylobacter oerskovii]
MDRLVKRKDFLAAAGGLRANSGPLLLQARDRADDGAVRIGLTVTKKHGNAVERNRIRRRLREAVRDALPRVARPGFDYVIVARRAALTTRFTDLVNDIERGITRLHSGNRRRHPPARPQPAAAHAAAQATAHADGETAHDE